MKQKQKINSYCEMKQIKEIDELEGNLQNAIDDLIQESDDKSDLVSQHTSMIITHLAWAAATLRMKKQKSVQKII